VIFVSINGSNNKVHKKAAQHPLQPTPLARLLAAAVARYQVSSIEGITSQSRRG